MSKVMGIIPYIDAAIATYDTKSEDVSFYDVPKYEALPNQFNLHGQGLLELIMNTAPNLICIETVDNDNPDERENFGVAKGILDGCGIETVYVRRDILLIGAWTSVPQQYDPKTQNAFNLAVHGAYVSRAMHDVFDDQPEANQ